MAAPSYQFLPWVRSGLAATLTDRDTLGAGVPGRARLGVNVRVSRQSGATPMSVGRELSVLGPGDVVGIDVRQVIRTDPRRGATDAEPNYLVQVEFDRPDLPWLFTPAAPTTTDRLRPWLVLVVVAQGRGVSLVDAAATGTPLPVLELLTDAEPDRQLPELGDSWAWAHAQAVLLPDESVDGVLAGVPARNASRLLCPRRLDPTTPYLACVVPAFEAGRRAGLGLEPEAADETSLRPAWTTPPQAPVRLPVYYSWEFATGVGGDFESLARALRPRPLPDGVGQQPVFFGAAGAPLPEVPPEGEGGLLGLPGALIAPGMPVPPWPAATRQPVERGLADLLNAPARRVGSGGGGGGADTEPVVGPPLSGQWPAGSPTVPGRGVEPLWLRTLNLDPRHRATAGLGAVIVIAEQERLMDQAWAQVGQVEEANRELRWARMAREVRASVLRRHLAPLPAPEVLAVTAAVHRRVRARASTVARAVTASTLPDAVVSGVFRRAAGPRAPLSKRVFPPGQREPGALARVVRQLDDGALTMGTPSRPPDGLFGFASAAPAHPGVPADVVAKLGSAREAARARQPRVLDHRRLGGIVLNPALSGRIATALGLPNTPAGALAARQFRDAAATVARRGSTVLDVPADPARPPLGVGQVVNELLARLDPSVTVVARIGARIKLPDSVRPRPGHDPLEEILAAPVFSQPAWELVRDHAPDLLLPGLHRVLQDTATLAETNPRFVEAVLVGLNHEIARELLWREYPTDQRGSPFRKFWAPDGSDDVPAVHTWRTDDLGGHSASGDTHLVLLVRGRLLSRYPGTVIYAAPDRSGRPNLEEDAVLLPAFGGRLDPDVAFCGFALDLDEARGTPGWWFVLEQQPTEPRFGLDVAVRFGAAAGPVNEWNDLSWGHLLPDADALAELTHLRTDLQPPSPPAGPRWGRTAAAMAGILVQQPVRVAMRAADLLASPPAPPPPPTPPTPPN